MATSYMSACVRCPFYKGDEGKRLICEGIDKKCNIHQQYESKDDKRKRMMEYCTKNYKKCELYKILENKYQK